MRVTRSRSLFPHLRRIVGPPRRARACEPLVHVTLSAAIGAFTPRASQRIEDFGLCVAAAGRDNSAARRSDANRARHPLRRQVARGEPDRATNARNAEPFRNGHRVIFRLPNPVLRNFALEAKPLGARRATPLPIEAAVISEDLDACADDKQ